MPFPSYDCLIDLIGVKGCSQPTPPSGLFINDLPGITLKSLDKIASEDDGNFLGVWATIQKRAAIRFRRDVVAKLAKRYRLKTITTSIDTGRKADLTSSVAPVTNFNGLIAELNQEGDTFIGSNFQQIYVELVAIFDKFGGNPLSFAVFDLDLGIELYTDSLAVSAKGWNVINVRQSFDARRVYIYYPQKLHTTINQPFQDVKNAVNTNGCWHICSSHCGCDFTVKSGVQVGATDPSLVVENNDIFGLQVQISAKCELEKLICRNINCFINAWWYLCGIELMNERIFSDRLNEFTVFDRNKAQQLHDKFVIDYQGGLIEQPNGNQIFRKGELGLAIKGINLDLADCCIECDAGVSMQESLP